jgi:hypothetical protein
MNTPSERNPLFPPTPRQRRFFLLTVLFLGLACALPISRVFLLLVSPWIVGMMITVFDKEGPIRNWLGSVVHSLFYPLALVVYNWTIMHEWTRFGRLPNPVIIAVVNLLLLGCCVFFLRYLWPLRCPGCGHRSMVPLMPLVFREKRSNSTHWCATCDMQYWKKKEAWEVERRKTWWDYARQKRRPRHEGADGAVPEAQAQAPV